MHQHTEARNYFS